MIVNFKGNKTNNKCNIRISSSIWDFKFEKFKMFLNPGSSMLNIKIIKQKNSYWTASILLEKFLGPFLL